MPDDKRARNSVPVSIRSEDYALYEADRAILEKEHGFALSMPQFIKFIWNRYKEGKK